MEQAYSEKARELLKDLVRVCSNSPQAAAALIHDNLEQLWPSLQGASSQSLPKLQLLQEQRVLLASSPHPQKLIEKIEQLKDAGVQGIDKYIWLVGQVMSEPAVKKLVSVVEGGMDPSSYRESVVVEPLDQHAQASSQLPNMPFSFSDVGEGPAKRSRESEQMVSRTASVVQQFHNFGLDDRQSESASWVNSRSEKYLDVPKPLIEGVSYPATPQWNIDRPYLTGQHLFQDSNTNPRRTLTPRGSSTAKESPSDKDSVINRDAIRTLGIYTPSVQELLVIDDLLYAMVGIEGKYVRVRRGRFKDGNTFSFYMDPSMDASIHELAKRVLPLCENYIVVSQFTEARSHFKHGLVNHAFAAALRAILQDYHAMVAQLEHQFRLTRLSLQGLWFFSQPMIAAMQALSMCVLKASTQNSSGAAILNLLHNQATAMAGDSAARALLQKLTHAASAPYFGILERWVYEGVIDDPYGEFLIDENKSLQKESLSQDYHATYWQQRYSLRRDIPGFLASSAETILTTGKYLNAVRECGHSIQIPFAEDANQRNIGPRRPYLERINIAYEFASAELLNLIIHKFDLMGRLRSVKHYFFVDQGDFLVHFMDTARDELAKRPSAMSMEKLQSLLELALRTSVAASDPYHEDLTCNIERSNLLTQLQNISQNGAGPAHYNSQRADSTDASSLQGMASGSITGLETFTLDYKVRWPLSLVISRKALTKYQLIFRHLFHCKHVERQLCATWQLHQVLEPNWHVMHGQLQSAKSIDEVMQHHDAFLDKCLKQCMLFWPQILKKVDKLKSICLHYAIATQWLIPALFRGESFDSQEPAFNSNKVAKKGYKSQWARQAADDTNFKTTVGKLDEEFIKELKSLVVLLSNGSQTEPYLAHLAQGLQAVEQAA
ncbi:hypothetical protein CY35_14G078000 [Sphagnum magellanicum]|nr:hypothetical protein CY35_14G078000 [Sphagnum magellanicum]